MEDFIKQLAKSSGKTEEELTELYNKVKTELETAGIKDERIINGAFGKKLRQLKWIEEHAANGGMRKKPITFFGFFLGTTRLVDIDEFKRRKAMNAFRDDPIQAQLQGLTDEAGTALDNRPVIKNRKGEEVENPNYHKTLISHTWTKTVYGIALKEGGAEPKFFRMQLWRNTAKTFKYRPFVPIQFSAMLKSEQTFIEIGPTKSTVFQTTEQEIPIETWIRKTCKIYSLSDLDKAHAVSNSAKDRWIFTEGTVENIDNEVNARTGSRSILLQDVDGGFMGDVRVFLPGDFPLGFHQYSRVIVLGETRKWKRRDEDEEHLSVEGFSMFPIPGKTVEQVVSMPKKEKADLQEDEGPELVWKD